MSLHLEIVTPNGSVLTEDVDEVVLPGKIGEFTVLEGHVALLSALKPGVVRYRRGTSSARLAIGSGFAEVGAEQRILVLTDDHAFPEQIDAAEARKELREASDALRGFAGEVEVLDEEKDRWQESADFRALRERVDWAQARLDARGAE